MWNFFLPNLEEIQSLRMIDVKKSEINPVFCQICFVVIYFLQNLFCCYLRASVWRKIKPKILYGEKNDRHHQPSHLSSSKSWFRRPSSSSSLPAPCPLLPESLLFPRRFIADFAPPWWVVTVTIVVIIITFIVLFLTFAPSIGPMKKLESKKTKESKTRPFAERFWGWKIKWKVGM